MGKKGSIFFSAGLFLALMLASPTWGQPSGIPEGHTLEPERLKPAGAGEAPPPTDGQTAQATQPPTPPAGQAPPRPVGEPPPEERPERPVVTTLYEAGGILTPPGALVLEPSLELTHASVNRFTFRGVELQEVVLIGVIEASDADRNLISPALTGRLGLTDRFELEAKVPYVYRDDRVTFLVPVLDETARTENLEGDGLGDVELAAHYQLTGGPLYLVTNLRGKLATGTGPFDVDRDEFGIATELSTGSGFYAAEPSLTFLYPSDPAILFANLSYQVNIPASVDERVGEAIVEDVDPGDAIGVSVGLGFAVNQDLSFSLGYKHTYVFGTETELLNTTTNTRRTVESNDLQVGVLLFGISHQFFDDVPVNLNFELGITSDAPDVRAVFRVPINVGSVF